MSDVCWINSRPQLFFDSISRNSLCILLVVVSTSWDLSLRDIKVVQYSKSQQNRVALNTRDEKTLKKTQPMAFFSQKVVRKIIVISHIWFLESYFSRKLTKAEPLQANTPRLFKLLSGLFSTNAVKVLCPTCLGVTGPMLVAVARHTWWQWPFAGVLPCESCRALLAKLTGKTQRTGTQFYPWGSDGPGRNRGDGSGGQGHTC